MLSLFFPAPATHPEYRSKPASFVSHLVGHEGPGSLLSVLKELGWATELTAGPGTNLPEESLFGVSIRLTEEGVPAWDSVVGLVFHLLHLVRASDVGVRRRLWWEVQTTTALNFKYRPKDREDVQSENMAFALHHYPPEEVLGASELIYEELDEANNNKVDTLLDKTLVPSNMRLHLACPAAEVPAFFGAGEAGEGGLEDDGWQSDKWFGTQFRVRAFSADLLARWSNWYTCLATDACVYTTRPHAHARPHARTYTHAHTGTSAWRRTRVSASRDPGARPSWTV